MTEEELKENIKHVLLDFYVAGGPLDEWVDKIHTLYEQYYQEAGYIPPDELTRPKSIIFEEPRIAAEIRQAISDCLGVKKSVAKSSHDCAGKIINLINNEVGARCPECGRTGLFKCFVW